MRCRRIVFVVLQQEGRQNDTDGSPGKTAVAFFVCRLRLQQMPCLLSRAHCRRLQASQWKAIRLQKAHVYRVHHKKLTDQVTAIIRNTLVNCMHQLKSLHTSLRVYLYIS